LCQRSQRSGRATITANSAATFADSADCATAVQDDRQGRALADRGNAGRIEAAELTITFAGAHLTAAEQHTARENYEAASVEVGMYHALIENALKFLSTSKRDSNKTRDLYKRLELALRADGPRLTAMRRNTPLEFAVWIKHVEDFARDGRTEALNSFYGHTVVREQKTTDDKPKEIPTPTPKSNQQ